MKKQKFILNVSCIFLSLVLLYSLLSTSSAQQGGSLYDRLGGSYTISAVVDDFVERLLVNEAITSNEKVIAGVNKITKAGLKFHMTEFICQATGGLQKYTGKSMKESHKGLDISEAQWAAMEKDFLASLAKFNVLDQEQRELLAIVKITKQDVVTAKAPTPETTAPAAAPQVAPEVAAPALAPQVAPEVAVPPAQVPEIAAPEVIPPPAQAPVTPEVAAPANLPQEAAPTGGLAEPTPTPIVAPQAPLPSSDVAPIEVVPELPQDPAGVGPQVPPGAADSVQPLP